MDNFHSPTFISSRSADVIISDVRPIKLKLEALRSINVLLDEILYNLLSAAGSVSTDKLKTSLIKILPTTVGKESILEAELELKAYLERTPQPSPVNGGSIEVSEQFDLQWSYELLRLKCEAYTTMNDEDEDEETEQRLNDRMVEAGFSCPPKLHMLAPAALYLTAILEHVCEHVLSLVSRVVARDPSRAVATVQDVFVALCEDDSMYGMFRTMKVYEQIETLSKTQKPRRNKSVNKHSDRASPAPKSPPATEAVLNPSPPVVQAKLRMSSESLRKSSSVIVQPNMSSSNRTSIEKMKAARIFGRSSSDNGEVRESTPSEMTRGHSEGSSINGSITSDLMEDAVLQDEFDELMRSGATMKVSLTPDRLKSMEVYRAERKRQLAQNNGTGPTSTELKRGHLGRRPSVRNVDAIVEDDEDTSPAPSAQTPTRAASPPSSFQSSGPRTRQISLQQANSVAASAANLRVRSVSVSAVSENAPKRKTEIPPPLPPFAATSPKMHRSTSAHTKSNGTGSGGPPRTRRVVRNPEELDLDEVMRGSGGEEEDDLPPAPLPRSKAVGSPTGYKKPYISQSARELIDFLDEGPPEEFGLSPANASMISFTSTKTSKSARFRSMMSRLTIGGSKENLNGMSRLLGDSPKTPKSASHRTYSQSRSPPPPPPPAFMQSSLNSKRSVPSLPNVIIATPPPPPPISPHQPSPQPSIDDFTHSNSNSRSHSHSPSPATSMRPSRRLSIVRKAVPTFDDGRESVAPLIMPLVDEPEVYPPSRSSSSVLRVVNGHDHSESIHLQQPTSTTIASDCTASSIDAISTPASTVASMATGAPLLLPKAEMKTISQAETPVDLEPPKPLPSVYREDGRDSTMSRGTLSVPELQVLRGLISVATTADECRLVVDMFLAKHGALTPTAPAPLTQVVPIVTEPLPASALANMDLEKSLVAVLLGDADDSEESIIEVPHQKDDTSALDSVPAVDPATEEDPNLAPAPNAQLPEISEGPTPPAVEVSNLRHSWQGMELL